ncbi:MAG: glycosyltransferase family 4 protein [Dehalococcoidia bacterium]
MPNSSLEIWTYEVACRLSETNDIHVFGGLPARSVRATAFRDRGISYHLLPTTPDVMLRRVFSKIRKSPPANRPLVARQSYYYFWALRTAWELRRLKPDVIHIHNQFPFARIIGRLNPRARIVVHMQSEWLSQVDRREVEPALKRTALVMGCSRHVTSKVEARELSAVPETVVVPNGVDTDAFHPLDPVRPGSEDRPLKLVFVGRVSPEKGCHALVQALAVLIERGEDVTLSLVGPVGALPAGHIVQISREPAVRDLQRFYAASAPYLEQILDPLPPEVRARVHIKGSVPREEVVREIREADILLNPSLSETFGMALVEAMASGIPVIATQVGGMPEVVEDGVTGILVAPESSNALADAIQTLKAHPESRRAMGAAGRDRTVRYFTWDAVAEQALKAYQSLVFDRAPATNSHAQEQILNTPETVK